MSAVTLLSQSKSFGGMQSIYSHESNSTKSTMRFGIYLPPRAQLQKVPVLYWLSGLTCTEENFIIKAGAQRVAAELGIAIVTCDTSPRGLNIPGDSDSMHLGVGAGFYVDATAAPWNKNYQMYTYVSSELPAVVAENFNVDAARAGIFGHSMGGHGALTIAIKNPEKFKSVSAFAPICAPTQSGWGGQALLSYLGDNPAAWNEYDSTALIKARGWKDDILIDQGTEDAYKANLRPDLFEQACRDAGVKLNLRYQEGYDHGYFFVASFIEDHLRFHAAKL